MLLIEGLRSLQRPTYLPMPIGGHHHQLRSLDLVGQLTNQAQAQETNPNPFHQYSEKFHFHQPGRSCLPSDPKYCKICTCLGIICYWMSL